MIVVSWDTLASGSAPTGPDTFITSQGGARVLITWAQIVAALPAGGLALGDPIGGSPTPGDYLVVDGSGNLGQVSPPPPPSVTIGDAVLGGTPGDMLWVDPGGNLGQADTLTYDLFTATLFNGGPITSAENITGYDLHATGGTVYAQSSFNIGGTAGASGSFSSNDGHTINVQGGIITSIS